MIRTDKERENRLSAYIDAMNEGRSLERVVDDDDEMRDLMDTTLRLRALKHVEHPTVGFAERVAQRLREVQAAKEAESQQAAAREPAIRHAETQEPAIGFAESRESVAVAALSDQADRLSIWAKLKHILLPGRTSKQ